MAHLQAHHGSSAAARALRWLAHRESSRPWPAIGCVYGMQGPIEREPSRNR